MSDSENTTDAIPSPPRDKENRHKDNFKRKEEKDLQEEGDRASPSPPPNFKYKERTTRPEFNMVQVINSQNVHIGNTTVQNISFSSNGRADVREVVKETEKMVALKKSTKPVLDKDIDVVKDHIGFGWQETFLLLGFKQGQIEQQKIRFHDDINGLIRFLLVDWRQANGKKVATVGVLAQVLWDTKQREALKVWSTKYDELHA